MTVYLLKEIGEDNVSGRLICIKNPYIMWKTIKQKKKKMGEKISPNQLIGKLSL